MTDLVEIVKTAFPYALSGSVTQVVGQTVVAEGFPAPLGSSIWIDRDTGQRIEAEVVGFQGSQTLMLSLGDVSGIRRGNRVRLYRSTLAVQVGQELLGRVLNFRGQPIDSNLPLCMSERRNILAPPIAAMRRPPIDKALQTGVKAIDSFLTLGVGQRMGLFSGSGVGKSTLLGQIARHSTADLNVIALVGERGREVREFLERDLGPTGMARSVVVVATSDEPPLHRYRAALVATTIAEHFRDQGNNVLLMMDSVTRFALAQREIGFARGEAPVSRGFPSSVFSALPQLLERSGPAEVGSITGLYTVLVEGDDLNEPIADTVRGILDGHIILSRKLAHQAHWPAIDILGSVSRLMNQLSDPKHRHAANQVRELMAAYRDSEDYILLGAYQPGSNPLVDRAIALRAEIHKLLRQTPEEHQSFPESVNQLLRLAELSKQKDTTQK